MRPPQQAYNQYGDTELPRGILVVEDDQTLLSVLQYNLAKEGHRVLAATDGEVGLALARSEKPDLVLLDIMLPKMSGFEVCRILRKETNVPILMLTARDDESDKVLGLDLGADDYITKPFSMRELLARVRASLRRTEMQEASAAGEVVAVGGLAIDIGRHIISVDGRPLELTPKEFDLLVFMARNRGLVFTREHLLQKIWGYDYPGDTRTVDVHIRWLREKVEKDPSKPEVIVTVRGVGYKLEG